MLFKLGRGLSDMANCNITCLYYYDTIRPDWTSYRNRKQKVELGIPVITKAFGGMTSHAGTKKPLLLSPSGIITRGARHVGEHWGPTINDGSKAMKKKNIVERQFPHGLVLRYLPFLPHDHPALCARSQNPDMYDYVCITPRPPLFPSQPHIIPFGPLGGPTVAEWRDLQ